MKNQRRIAWIDQARGMAILLVVLGHCCGDLENPVNRFVLAFHMPAFFFLSGLCAKTALGEGKGLKNFFLRKVQTLVVPQLVLGVLNCVFTRSITAENFLTWFLPVLLYVSVLFEILLHGGWLNGARRYAVLAVAAALAVLIDRVGVATMLHLEIVPMAFVFYWLGVLCKDRLAVPAPADWQTALWLPLLPAVVLLSALNEPVAMYENRYGSLLLFFAGALLGIAMLCSLAKALKNNRLLLFFGQNSIIVYILHIRLLNVLHVVGKKLLPALAEANYLYPANWGYFLVTAALLIPCVYICNRWLPFLFGKKRTAA